MASVVVVGAINIDLVIRLQRLPARGETVTGGTFTTTHGGKGANQSIAARRLGADVTLIGAVGDDAFGRETVENLKAEGVDISRVVLKRKPTGVAQIMVDDEGENVVAVAPGANSDLAATEVEAEMGKIPARNAVVVASLEVPDAAVIAAARTARRLGWRFVLNPAPAYALSTGLLASCDILTPNEHEVGLLGMPVENILQNGVQAIIITRGADGADLVRSGRPVLHQSAFEVDVVDTTGAGDAFSATLAWALAEGRPLEDALRLAAAGGALATRSLGARTGFASRSEVERLAAKDTSLA